MNRTEEKQQIEKFAEFQKMYPPFVRNLDTDLCIPQVAQGWEWCFNPEQCYVMEKLNGTNVKIEVQEGVMIVGARNQKTKGYMDVNLNDPQYKYIMQGVANAVAKRGKRFRDGVYFGEVVGAQYEGNPYQMDTNLWLTFDKASDGAQVYKDAPQTNDFETWKEWILNLKSLFNPEVEAEGVIFVNKITGERAKLRKDMFDVKYQPVRRKYKRK